MKQIDSFKIAAHNLWNNKSRTVLTVIIVTVVSALIMALLLIGIAFANNQVKVNKLIFESEGTTYTLSSRYTSGMSSWRQYGTTMEEYKAFTEIAERYSHIIGGKTVTVTGKPGTGNDSYNYLQTFFAYGVDPAELNSEEAIRDWARSHYTYQENVTLRDLSYAKPEAGLIREGRVWTEKDNELNNLWISNSRYRTLTQNGADIHIGDTVPVVLVTETQAMMASYKLVGVYDADVMEEESNYWYPSYSHVLSVDYFLEQFSEMLNIETVQLSYTPPATDYDYNAVFSDMSEFTDEVNAIMEPSRSTYNGTTRENERFSCAFVDEMQMVVLMSAIIVGVVSILALIVLLLSVGSVANTIIISVDKDRKFLGLMKAIGLNQRGVKRIVTYQSLLQILIGVALGVLILFLLQPMVLSVMTSIFASMFSYFEVEYTVTVAIPFYLPLITALLFFLFAMLFSRSALSKIARQDAISTISEVA